MSNKLNSTNPFGTIFYSLEEVIKNYRKLSFNNIKSTISDLTVDQALILQIINDQHLSQTEIANLMFKDYASMTRIIALMIKKNYLIKTPDEKDRRVAKLKITLKGIFALKQLTPIIKQNRETALRMIADEDLNTLKTTLNKININCRK